MEPADAATEALPYRSIARFYDAIYHARGRSPADEVDYLSRYWNIGKPRSGAMSILDAGCGTGIHLPHLADHGVVTGFDASEDMILFARRRHPGIDLSRADLRDLDLGRTFDVVTCLFGVIAYLTDPDDLARAIGSLGRHVNGGGLLLVEPPLLAERMTEPRPQYVEIEFEGGTLSRRTETRRDGECLEIRFDWRHETAGCEAPVEILETHRLLVLDSSTWIDRFERGLPPGWTITMDPEGPIGRGLLVARFNGDGVPDSG